MSVVVAVGCLAVQVMRESRKTWRSVITFSSSAASAWKSVFIAQRNRQHHSAAMNIWPQLNWGCALHFTGASLKAGARPGLLLKFVLNASVCAQVLQVLSDFRKHQNRKETRRSAPEEGVTFLNFWAKHFRSLSCKIKYCTWCTNKGLCTLLKH